MDDRIVSVLIADRWAHVRSAMRLLLVQEPDVVVVGEAADVDEAIAHINKYGTGHSEAIVTESLACSRRFMQNVDAAAVYVNASTRFTDGNEFGFGAEIGISTQKLHARGPMGVNALTTEKYQITGSGQIRE